MSRRGFSLAETVVALLVLSTLSVVLVGVVPATVMGTRTSGNRAVASLIAWQKIESMRGSNLAALADGPLPPVTSGSVRYNVDLTTWLVLAEGGATLDPKVARGVTVKVSWDDRPNVVASYTACTTLYRQ